MKFLETEMKELSRSRYNNTNNTSSLNRTLKYVPDNHHYRQKKTLRWKHKKTHIHTHSHIHTLAIIFSCHNNSFLINDAELFKLVAFNLALFDPAVFDVDLF